jgi:transposase-like protein
MKAAVAKLDERTWQRCRVHTMPNALAHAGKSGRRVVSAFIATACAHDSVEVASSARSCWSRTTNGRSRALLYDAGNHGRPER